MTLAEIWSEWSRLVRYVLGGKCLPTPLALTSGPSLVDLKKKSEQSKLCGFYESLALKHMRPKGYQALS